MRDLTRRLLNVDHGSTYLGVYSASMCVLDSISLEEEELVSAGMGRRLLLPFRRRQIRSWILYLQWRSGTKIIDSLEVLSKLAIDLSTIRKLICRG